MLHLLEIMNYAQKYKPNKHKWQYKCKIWLLMSKYVTVMNLITVVTQM